jgi:hypothetical protein
MAAKTVETPDGGYGAVHVASKVDIFVKGLI